MVYIAIYPPYRNITTIEWVRHLTCYRIVDDVIMLYDSEILERTGHVVKYMT